MTCQWRGNYGHFEVRCTVTWATEGDADKKSHPAGRGQARSVTRRVKKTRETAAGTRRASGSLSGPASVTRSFRPGESLSQRWQERARQRHRRRASLRVRRSGLQFPSHWHRAKSTNQTSGQWGQWPAAPLVKEPKLAPPTTACTVRVFSREQTPLRLRVRVVLCPALAQADHLVQLTKPRPGS